MRKILKSEVFYMLLIGALILSWGLYLGCAGKQNRDVYLGSRIAFNNFLESYIGYRATLKKGSPEYVKAEEQIRPRFEEAEAILDNWGEVVDTPSGENYQRVFDVLLDAILIELVKNGIITKGGN
jgi:hypothetical protein